MLPPYGSSPRTVFCLKAAFPKGGGRHRIPHLSPSKPLTPPTRTSPQWVPGSHPLVQEILHSTTLQHIPTRGWEKPRPAPHSHHVSSVPVTASSATREFSNRFTFVADEGTSTQPAGFDPNPILHWLMNQNRSGGGGDRGSAPSTSSRRHVSRATTATGSFRGTTGYTEDEAPRDDSPAAPSHLMQAIYGPAPVYNDYTNVGASTTRYLPRETDIGERSVGDFDQDVMCYYHTAIASTRHCGSVSDFTPPTETPSEYPPGSIECDLERIDHIEQEFTGELDKLRYRFY